MSNANTSDYVSKSGHVLTVDEGKTVLEAARERVAHLFEAFDRVIVSFSGGKDSTVALHLCLDEARKRGALPLKVVMFDEEIIDPDTIEYCHRIRQNPEFEFMWFCVPILHTLRSQLRHHWITWDPEYRDVWARDMPDGAVTTDDFASYQVGMTIPEALMLYFPPERYGRIAVAGGIRIQESFNRRRALQLSGSWMTFRSEHYCWAKPVFDWSWQDVWRYILANGFDHSAFYDKLWLKGVPPREQRVAPWGNVAAIREARFYPEFYPDFWERVIRRLPEMRAQTRYGTTSLFSRTTDEAKPPGMTWQEYAMSLLEQFDDPEVQAYWRKQIEGKLRQWGKISSLPFPDEPVYVDGSREADSWHRMCKIIQKNDLVKQANGGFSSRDNI